MQPFVPVQPGALHCLHQLLIPMTLSRRIDFVNRGGDAAGSGIVFTYEPVVRLNYDKLEKLSTEQVPSPKRLRVSVKYLPWSSLYLSFDYHCHLCICQKSSIVISVSVKCLPLSTPYSPCARAWSSDSLGARHLVILSHPWYRFGKSAFPSLEESALPRPLTRVPGLAAAALDQAVPARPAALQRGAASGRVPPVVGRHHLRFPC